MVSDGLILIVEIYNFSIQLEFTVLNKFSHCKTLGIVRLENHTLEHVSDIESVIVDEVLWFLTVDVCIVHVDDNCFKIVKGCDDHETGVKAEFIELVQ